MNYFLGYLLSATIFLNALFLFYRFFFYKLSYLQWNRLFLLLMPVVSLLLPILHVPKWFLPEKSEAILIDFNHLGRTVLFNTEHISAKNSFLSILEFLQEFTIDKILLFIYLIGILIFLLLFVKHFLQIYFLIKRNKSKKRKGLKIIELSEEIPAFSFFRYVFISKLYRQLSNVERKQILQHEAIHVKQYHSIDILLYEVLNIFLWFNPLIIKIKQSLREAHEYIADNRAAKVSNKKTYSKLLLKMSLIGENSRLVNTISKTQLKNRVRMLMQAKGEDLRKISLFIAVPLLIILIVMSTWLKDLLINYQPEYNFKAETEFICPLKEQFSVIQYYYKDKIVWINKDDKTKLKTKVSHPRISFKTVEKNKIYASADGVVTEIKEKDNWGVLEIEISIKHKNNYTSLYKGLYRSLTKVGEEIKQGQAIAISGSLDLYPLISFQLKKDNKPIDPMPFFKTLNKK